jgi:hypothetical protein
LEEDALRYLLAFALIVALAAPVAAVPVEGTISGGVAGSDFRTLFDIQGAGIEYRTNPPLSGSDPPLIVGSRKRFNTLIDISHTLFVNEFGILTVDGLSGDLFTPVRGQIRFDIEPFVASPTTVPAGPNFFFDAARVETPFTIAGTISQGNLSADIEGSGVLLFTGFGPQRV